MTHSQIIALTTLATTAAIEAAGAVKYRRDEMGDNADQWVDCFVSTEVCFGLRQTFDYKCPGADLNTFCAVYTAAAHAAASAMGVPVAG